jgi:hypothetical protein
MRFISTGARVTAVGVVLAAILLLVACPQQRNIADIINDPGRYADKEVGVRGTVDQSFGALGTGMYQVDDGTGKIWVYAENRAVPGKGARVGVSGKVQPTFTFAGKSFATVIRETGRR